MPCGAIDSRSFGRRVGTGSRFWRQYLWRRLASRESHEFLIRGDEIAILIQVADHQFGSLANRFVHIFRTQLPHQVVSQGARFGDEVFKGRPLRVLKIPWAAESRIEIVLEI